MNASLYFTRQHQVLRLITWGSIHEGLGLLYNVKFNAEMQSWMILCAMWVHICSMNS